MPKIVLFDFDGVLADTEEAMLRFSRIACEELGYAIQPTRADLEAVEHMSFANLGRRFGLPEGQIAAYVRRSLQLFSENPLPLKAFPGIPDLLERLSQDASIAIVSGNSTPTIEKFLEDYQLRGRVQVIRGADNPGSKPEKIREVLAALERRDGAAYVGDTVSDISAARETSLISIAVSWGHHNRRMLRKAVPDYLVDTPDELLSVLKSLD